MGRILGQSSHRTAQAIVDVVSRALLRPGDTEADLARRLAILAEAVLPVLDRVTGSALRLHLLDVIQREAVVRLEGDLAGARDVTVAFADLAGFTALSDRLAIEDLGRIAARFEELATGVAEPPVRLVKVLGDGAMFAADDACALVTAQLDLVAAAADEDLPPVHAGVAHGPALHSAGDWLGRTVNLAARLCTVAPPWTVLATAEVRTACGDALGWEGAGRVRAARHRRSRAGAARVHHSCSVGRIMISLTATRHGRVTMYSIASAMSSAVSRSTPSKRLCAASRSSGPICSTSSVMTAPGSISETRRWRVANSCRSASLKAPTPCLVRL